MLGPDQRSEKQKMLAGDLYRAVGGELAATTCVRTASCAPTMQPALTKPNTARHYCETCWGPWARA